MYKRRIECVRIRGFFKGRWCDKSSKRMTSEEFVCRGRGSRCLEFLMCLWSALVTLFELVGSPRHDLVSLVFNEDAIVQVYPDPVEFVNDKH